MESWPEPVVSVQSVADACPDVIPERYIKPPSQRPSQNSSADPHLNIPVIDLGNLSEARLVSCPSTVRAISAACRDWGFFQVVNHGVSPELLRRIRKVWRGFFHLPIAEKRVYANSPKTYEGFGSRLGVEKGAILDWGDYFFLHLLPPRLKDHCKWPSMPEDCRATVEEYGKEVLRLCGALMKVLSVSLGLEESRLQEAFGGEDVGACMRVNFYPRCPQPDLTLGLSSHSDPGGITILLADEAVEGLQVRRGDGWVTVQPVTDAFIVNVGDQIQVLSNATYNSVEHRVIVNSAAERLSLAFFYNPRSDLPIGPLSELLRPGQLPLYQPMTFDEYRMYIRTKGPRGKSQVKSMEG